jgi:hypothetical protein
MTSTNIERSIDLNFPLDKVKQDIERVIQQGVYTKHSANDTFNTYRIGKLTGLEMISMNVTLKVLENANTNIHIVVTEKIRNSGHQLIVEKMIDAFLERLGKALTGVPDEGLKFVSDGNKGCAIISLIMIGVALAATASASVILLR